MARILITGGAGYVGSHCAKALAAVGHESVIFDNLVFGHREFVRWGQLIEGDIRDSAALDAVFSAYRFDAVMHFAALAYVGESVTAPGRYYDVNVNGTRTLLDAMVRAGVHSIIFPHAVRSTASRIACQSPSIWRPIQSIPMASASSFALMRRADVTGTNYPTPDGTAVGDYVHVEELARAHVLALQHLLENGDTIAVNLGTGRGASVVTIEELARRYAAEIVNALVVA